MKDSGKVSLGILTGAATGALCGVIFNIAVIIFAVLGTIHLSVATLWNSGDIFSVTKSIIVMVGMLVGIILGWAFSGAAIGGLIGFINGGPIAGIICG